MRRVMIIPLLVCLLLGAFPVAFAQEAQPGKSEEDNGYAQISIFAKALELIRQDYVDDNKTSYHDLVTAAMKGMLSSLDPHSQFMDPNDFRDMQDDTRSRFNGLGIEVSIKSRSVKGAGLLDVERTGPFKSGYIWLIQFNEPTSDELSKAMEDLQKQGM